MKCYFCDKEAVIVCDWCNTPFCEEHWKKGHTNLDCEKIEKDRLRRKFVFEKVFH